MREHFRLQYVPHLFFETLGRLLALVPGQGTTGPAECTWSYARSMFGFVRECLANVESGRPFVPTRPQIRLEKRVEE